MVNAAAVSSPHRPLLSEFIPVCSFPDAAVLKALVTFWGRRRNALARHTKARPRRRHVVAAAHKSQRHVSLRGFAAESQPQNRRWSDGDRAPLSRGGTGRDRSRTLQPLWAQWLSAVQSVDAHVCTAAARIVRQTPQGCRCVVCRKGRLTATAKIVALCARSAHWKHVRMYAHDNPQPGATPSLRSNRERTGLLPIYYRARQRRAPMLNPIEQS